MDEPSVDGDGQGGLQLLCFSDAQAKEFQCPVCAKYFSRKFTLDAHMLIHKGEKPHMCQFCGKSFRQKGTLMRHKALHSSKHLFHCSLCNRGFRQKNVFIHHLRHRHSVSTETLDRRKYRTEPKDYQSIMDTLPSFVHVDSTAIASSGKHFDDLLSKSIKNTDAGHLESSQCTSDVENVINSTINTLNNSDQINITINDPSKLCSVASCESELGIDEDYFEDIKPIFNNNACEINPTLTSTNGVISDEPYTINNSNIFIANSHVNNVTSSNDINDESIVCLPCHRSFNNESEFKCHMQTHVQSVLLGDVSSSDFSSDMNPLVFSGSRSSPNSVLSSNSSMLVSNSTNKISKNLNDNSNSMNTSIIPVKVENSDYEVNNNLSSKETNGKPPMPSSSATKKKMLKGSNIFCPVCRTYYTEVETFKNHAKKHDPYLLLKLYCEALGAKDMPNVSHNTVLNVTSKNFSFKSHHDSFNKRSHQKSQIEFGRDMTNNKLNKFKNPKRFQCIQCKKYFSNKILYEYHHQLHLSTKGFSCRCCKKKFLSKMLLLSHTRMNHCKTFSCPKCSRIFNYRKLLNLHKEKCMHNYDVKTSNGSKINFPVVSIESLLNSDMDGIIGIIPVCNTANKNEKTL